MKTRKFFQSMLLAMALMPVTANAQTSNLNFEGMTQEALTEVSLNDDNGFKVVAKSDKGKVDGSSLNFAYASTDENIETSFTQRWNVGAPLTPTTANRNMTITVPSAGTLNVYVRCGNKTATDRTLVLKQGDSEIFNKVIKDEDAFLIGEATCYPIVSVEVAAGDITVTTNNTINFYGFSFTPTAASSVDVTITDAGYATFANNTVGTLALPSGVKAYGVSAVNGGSVSFTEYNVIPAGVGVILEGAAGNYTLDPTDVESTYAGDNLLVAVTADMTVPATGAGKINYIFANKSQGVGFYKSSGSGTISKGKAYLSIPDESADNRSWDFTASKIWSDATIANLEVDRAVTDGDWRSNASKTDEETGITYYRYMCYNISNTEAAELTANGQKIAELEGLLFRGTTNRVGIDNRAPNHLYFAGNNVYVVIPDLKAGSTVTISTKSSSNSANAKMTCESENVVAQEADDALERDNVFTIKAFGSYEFQPDRGLYINSITVEYPVAAAAPAFFAISGDTTGIANIERQPAGDNVYYDLRGQRVANPTKGLYIVNGKKVIFK